jgi:nucleoside 2-deoxyribosyltransferase
MRINSGELNKMKAYLAAPWFTETQKSVMDKVRGEIIKSPIDVFSPYYDGTVLTKDNDSPEMRKIVFNINVRSINGCDLVIAVIDDFDPGTIFEMGVSYKSHIPIIAYSDVQGRGLNVMLQMAVWGFSNGLEQLSIQLDRFLLGKGPKNYLTWKKGDVT